MITGKRRPLHTSSGSFSSSSSGNCRSQPLNFRPNSTQESRGGTRPTASPSSVGLILVTAVLHVCKKSLLFDTKLKAALYLATIFLGSIVTDYIKVPRTYFSRSDNALNRYFIKWAWGWLLTTMIPWVVLTAHTIGCGRRTILIKHLVRLLFATCAWIAWMNFFHYIETNFGRCYNTKDPLHQEKAKCLQAGKFWSGLDISGHAFIIIYSSLILAEEGKTLIGWEGIKDTMIHEEHVRSLPNESSTGFLRNLCDEDLDFLKKAHKVLTPYLRGLFVTMTLQQLLWDVMLVATILYYHNMAEKFLGGVAAILTWYVTYHWLFQISSLGFTSPRDGLFKYYVESKKNENNSRLKRNTRNGLMWM
ncbi:fat storage-inducing transmembrane protein isoform X2 [Belonocnema kinseyi]|uniref:fat storage-inducing transmembrane protein isoform X2 n=1 Tax=Belonocnema kinseyi TaxID=2817044 RepID=UPI00143DD84C|nr:fat storage-inducing transmembrane protein isoform X2 [Belonocnema kinseyi]